MFAASKTSTATSGYQISRSLRFNSADTAYLNRTPATASNQKTWTWSGWIKLCTPASGSFFGATNSGANDTIFLFFSNNGLQVNMQTGVTQKIIAFIPTLLRDPSAWYHIVYAFDTTQAISSNGVKMYVNGVAYTATILVYTQNYDTAVNSVNPHGLGARSGGSPSLDGYMTEVNFIDGQQLTPSSFGETNAQTGVWQPKA